MKNTFGLRTFQLKSTMVIQLTPAWMYVSVHDDDVGFYF